MPEQKEIYLDHAATTPVRQEVLDAMLPYFTENYGNPSSLYSVAEKSKDAIEDSRLNISSVLGCTPREIIFTSGGTESDNAAIKGVALAQKEHGNHIITSSIEHHAVLDSCKFLEDHLGFEVTYLPVDKYGTVNPIDVKNSLTDRTILVSIMYANNEIGTVQKISQISSVIRNFQNQIGRAIPFHTDAVQAAGYLDLNVATLGIDLLSLSAHKIYGPKGIGALYVKQNTPFIPYQSGGGQEMGNRSGTQNVPAIVGFSTALSLVVNNKEQENSRCLKLVDHLWNSIKDNTTITKRNNKKDTVLPNNLNFTLNSMEGDAAVLALNQSGIFVSTGSACSSGSQEPSHVLTAIGLTREEAWSSIRISVGQGTTIDMITDAATAIKNMQH